MTPFKALVQAELDRLQSLQFSSDIHRGVVLSTWYQSNRSRSALKSHSFLSRFISLGKVISLFLF